MADRPFRPPRPEAVVIPGPAGPLEALAEDPGEPSTACVVVCHPHPLYHGTMNNKVVHALARAAHRLGLPSVRFNFRGVGASAGAWDEGRGETGDALAAAEWARARWPRLRIAGTNDGYFSPDDSDRVAATVRASGADVLLVAMGAPRQELWIGRYADAAGASATLGVGGLFDYYSGRIPRAPVWMRRLGLEWIFRLLQEPRRLWRRYLVGNLVFLWRVAGDWLCDRARYLSPRRSAA